MLPAATVYMVNLEKLNPRLSTACAPTAAVMSKSHQLKFCFIFLLACPMLIPGHPCLASKIFGINAGFTLRQSAASSLWMFIEPIKRLSLTTLITDALFLVRDDL
jgi:hypothetical protein